jgi:hypothetical protein
MLLRGSRAAQHSVDLRMRVVDHLPQALKMPSLKVRQHLVTSADRMQLGAERDRRSRMRLYREQYRSSEDLRLQPDDVYCQYQIRRQVLEQHPETCHLKGKTIAVTGGTNKMQKALVGFQSNISVDPSQLVLVIFEFQTPFMSLLERSSVR